MVGSKYRIASDPFKRDDTPISINVRCKHLLMEDGCPRCKSIHGCGGKHPLCAFPMMQKHCEGFEAK